MGKARKRRNTFSLLAFLVTVHFFVAASATTQKEVLRRILLEAAERDSDIGHSKRNLQIS
jgi:hypothetical protein